MRASDSTLPTFDLPANIGKAGCLLALFCAAWSTSLAQESPTKIGTRRFGDDWPVFLGPTGDSKSTEKGIRKDWTDEGLPLVWQMPLTQSYGTCTISGGRLFQFDSEPVGSPRRGKNVGKLLCLHSETGKEIWNYRFEYDYHDQYGYNNGPRCSPIVDGDRVYAYGVDGRIVCLKTKDGSEVWQKDLTAEFGVVQNFFGVGSNPVIYGDKLIVMVGGSPKQTRIDMALGNGSGIVALDKHTGKVEYKLSDELASYASLKLVQSRNRAWCFSFSRGGLLGFDPETGKEDFFYPWRATIIESVNASVPVVWGKNVFISETYGPGSTLLDFGKITDGNARVVWKDEKRSRDKAMQTHWNTCVYHDGYLYGSSGRHSYNAELRCIEAATGKVMWSKAGLSRCSLLYVDGHLVCLSEVGLLLLLKATPDGYTEVAEKMFRDDTRPLLRSPAWAAPVLSHGLLYLRGADRLLCAELIANKD